MSKRAISFVLVLMMIFSMTPAVAMAEECNNPECTHVAAIGNDHYYSIQDAVNAAPTGTTTAITVLNSHEVDCGQLMISSDNNNKVVLIISGKDIVIDLNGNTITANAHEQNQPSFTSFIWVDANSKLTLQDNSSDGTGRIDVVASPNAVANLLRVHANGRAEINSGTYTLDKSTNGSGMIDSRGDEIITINGGTFYLYNVGSESNGSPWVLNTSGQNTKNILVNSGTFNADILHQYYPFEVAAPKERALRNNGDGTWTMVDAVAYVNEHEKSGNWYTNEVGYATFEEAVAAANNYINNTSSAGQVNTITLLKDCVVEDSVMVEGNITIKTADDAPAVTLSGKDGAEPVINVTEGAVLTIESGIFNVPIATTTDESIKLAPEEGAELNFGYDLPSGCVTSGGAVIVQFNGTTPGGIDVPGYPIETQVITSGETATLPSITIEGKTAKWYTIGGFESGTVFDFDSPITQNTSLYAIWTPNPHTVTYTDGVDGTVLFEDQVFDVSYGDDTPIYNPGSKIGRYEFLGWSPEVAATVTGDAVYTATWNVIPSRPNRPAKPATPENPATPPAGDTCDGTVASGCHGAEFVDINTKAWYHEAVDYVVENGIMEGVGGNRFAPSKEVTRAQVVTILYRIEGSPDMTGNKSFKDIPAGEWYTDAVIWAAENGIVNGFEDGSFFPGRAITREQMAAIFCRYAEYKGVDIAAEEGIDAFADAGNVSKYATDSMNWAVESGLISGTNGKLMPKDDTTRVQAAAIIMRYCEEIAK